MFPNEERVFKLVKLYGTMNFVRINSSDSEEIIELGKRLKESLEREGQQ